MLLMSRSRRLPQTQFAVWNEMPHAIGFSKPPDSWIAPTLRSIGVDDRPRALRRSPGAADKTSRHRGRSGVCVRSDPKAASARSEAMAMPPRCYRHVVTRAALFTFDFALSAHFPTLNFALSTFSGGPLCVAMGGRSQ